MEPEKKKQTIKYLVWAFGIAWVMQIIVAVCYGKDQIGTGRLIMAVMMFCPLLAVKLCGSSLSEMGWKPRLRGNLKPYLAAWFLPFLLAAVGGALYFLIFPGHLDLTGEQAMGGGETLRLVEEQGLTYNRFMLINCLVALTYAPLLNMLLAVGEEAGWRGFLYPRLKEAFGPAKGRLLGGIVWGVWHWPVIGLIGYEYGTGYVGFPVSGMLVFCLFTIACGILCDYLYEKGGTIWIPALLHGSINGAATLPLMICIEERGSLVLLGPLLNGLLAGLPLFILAAVLLKRGEDS